MSDCPTSVDLEAFYRDIIGVTEEELLRVLVANSDQVHLMRGERLISQGDGQTHVYFLAHGVMCGYVSDELGHETTDCILYTVGDPAAPSADLDVPSPSTIAAVVESHLIGLRISAVPALLQTSLQVVQLYNMWVMRYQAIHAAVKDVVAREDARGRCQWFLEEYADVADVIADKDAASFLGMTPVTLSRVKSSLRGKAN